MKVMEILKTKGSAVMTIAPDETAQALAKKLREKQVGSMIVSSDGISLDGIVSERDVAYGLAVHGAELSSLPVAALMTHSVITCSPEDSITEVMKVMTQRRVRHLPVMDGDELAGVISIGDVLKHRLEELRMEANVLRDYAIAMR